MITSVKSVQSSVVNSIAMPVLRLRAATKASSDEYNAQPYNRIGYLTLTSGTNSVIVIPVLTALDLNWA